MHGRMARYTFSGNAQELAQKAEEGLGRAEVPPPPGEVDEAERDRVADRLADADRDLGRDRGGP